MSSTPTLEIPDVDIWQLRFEQPKTFSEEKKIYVDHATTAAYSFGDVRKQATKLGSILSSRWNWAKGDVLAVVAANSIDMPGVIWGTHYCGGTVSPMNPAYTASIFPCLRQGLMAIVHSSMYNGLQVVVMEQFKLEAFCQAVQDYKITYVHVVPPIVLQLAKSSLVDRYDLSSIRMLVSAAAPLSKDLVQAIWKKRHIKVIQGYGLSETCAGTHMQTGVGMVGKIFANMQARFVSAEGLDVSAGELGELWLKGPNIFPGYLNDPESTSQCFSKDGFFMTGDIGFEDAAGNFKITDRVKELIKYKGFQVAPAELEGILLGHGSVTDACVFGVDDEEQATQVPVACIVLQQDTNGNWITANTIKHWIDAKVSNAKRMRGGVFVVDEIPNLIGGRSPILHMALLNFRRTQSQLSEQPLVNFERT
ncbi:acetyl-CoA synthetase-like protein [Aureobasidium subglaciale]|nr:acetyl-CoA synthetase-like protein [Aureobasidium subglaciale]